MIVLDTNVVSELMRASIDPLRSRWLVAQEEIPLATTSITVMEVAYGLARLPDGNRRKGLERRFEAFVEMGKGLAVLDLDANAARLAGQLRARRDAFGHPSSQADMMIAGICVLNSAVLATRNVRDFEQVGLELVNPFRAAEIQL